MVSFLVRLCLGLLLLFEYWIRLFADNCSNYSTVYNMCTTNRTETDREYKQRSTTNATYEQRNTP